MWVSTRDVCVLVQYPINCKISISRSLPVLIPPFFCLVQVVAERALKVLRSDEAESKQFLEEDLVTLNAEEEELGKDLDL